MDDQADIIQEAQELQVAQSWLRDVLEKGIDLQEEEQRAFTIDRLRTLCRKAEEMEQPSTACKAAMLLALIHYKAGDLERALAGFEHVRTLVIDSDQVVWYSALTSLTSLLQAHKAAEEARRRIESTMLDLREEVTLLEQESMLKINELWRTLLENPSNNSSQTAINLTRQADTSPDLRVQLLGRFRVARGDGSKVMLCANRNGQAIFRMMSTNAKRRYHRERLLDAFWRDEDPDTAMGKLHVAISRLRRSLVTAGFPEDVLQFSNDSYYFMSGLTIETDLDMFKAHLQAGQRMEAVGEVRLAIEEYETAKALYGGEYLADLVGETWLLTTRAAVEQDYLSLLNRLANCYYRCQRYQDAEQADRLLLEYDNLREDVYRHLMRCLSQLGQRTQVIRLYQELEALLQAELGVKPTQTTTDLMLRIKDEKVI